MWYVILFDKWKRYVGKKNLLNPLNFISFTKIIHSKEFNLFILRLPHGFLNSLKRSCHFPPPPPLPLAHGDSRTPYICGWLIDWFVFYAVAAIKQRVSLSSYGFIFHYHVKFSMRQLTYMNIFFPISFVINFMFGLIQGRVCQLQTFEFWLVSLKTCFLSFDLNVSNQFLNAWLFLLSAITQLLLW